MGRETAPILPITDRRLLVCSGARPAAPRKLHSRVNQMPHGTFAAITPRLQSSYTPSFPCPNRLPEFQLSSPVDGASRRDPDIPVSGIS